MQNSESLTEIRATNGNYPSIAESPPRNSALPSSCIFAVEINHIATEQLKYARSSIYDNVRFYIWMSNFCSNK